MPSALVANSKFKSRQSQAVLIKWPDRKQATMKKLTLAATIFVVQTAALNATSIGISLGETRTTPTFGTAFNQLDGQSLNGQTLSLDFVFTDNFVRFLPPAAYRRLAQTSTFRSILLPMRACPLANSLVLQPVLVLFSIRLDARSKHQRRLEVSSIVQVESA